MSLTRKQSAALGACLCLIRDHGYDVGAVVREIRARESNGTPSHRACEDTLARFKDRAPSMRPALDQATRLASEGGVSLVAHYNVALRSYLETGDDSRLNSLAPVLARAFTELAARHGEAAPEFSDEVNEMVAAANAPAPPPPTDVYVNSSQARPASFQFSAPAPNGEQGPQSING